jgi:glyoxalase/bleomycin resistance protein/dioxygenase superfamily protein
MSLFDDARPVRALGDLLSNIWQVCYVTPDLDAGMALLRDRYGIESTEVPTDGATFLAGEEPAPWDVRVSMGARRGPIVELIEPVAGEVDFYRRALRDDGELGFHHVATYVPLGDESWSVIGDLLAGEGLGFEYTVLIPDRVRAGYVDTTKQLGHYLEVCQLQPADTEFFDSLIET